MKASEYFDEHPTLKLLVYGDSGSGKTMFGATAPMPFIIATETQAKAPIAIANANADVEFPTTYPKVSVILSALTKGSIVKLDNGQPAFRFTLNKEVITCQTVVLDSLTDVHERLTEHFLKKNKDGEEGIDWIEVQKIMRRVCMALRDLPVNVIVTCLAQTSGGEVRDAKGNVIKVVPTKTLPMLYGKTPDTIGQFFNAVAYAVRTDSKRHALCWNMNGRFLSKLPPTHQPFPDFTFSDLRNPGKCTLGSILLALYPGLNVAHNDTDAESHVYESTDDE